ncbi:GNAT family N-acetyltransferase [Paenarthrobacter sp. NPDC089316]|uniref:GNAT family N-acetyltransferase n=1 Tax=unclassified Paenarthrobacter TaxID=2634190 RepID=UPI003413BC37
MSALFDAEYEADWGPWNAKAGCGFPRGELHCFTREGSKLIGYAASARRFVGVGVKDLVVAGVGGVLTSAASRGRGIGRKVIYALQEGVVRRRPISVCWGAVRKSSRFISHAASNLSIHAFEMFRRSMP